jgi:hypothetical protein
MPDKAVTFRVALDTIAQGVPQRAELDTMNKFFQPTSAKDMLEQAEQEKSPILETHFIFAPHCPLQIAVSMSKLYRLSIKLMILIFKQS